MTIIFADTWEEHHHILEKVLNRICNVGLELEKVKCQFGQTSVKFLGHVVSARGTEPDPEKVKAVCNFLHPPLQVNFVDSLEWHPIIGVL